MKDSFLKDALLNLLICLVVGLPIIVSTIIYPLINASIPIRLAVVFIGSAIIISGAINLVIRWGEGR